MATMDKECIGNLYDAIVDWHKKELPANAEGDRTLKSPHDVLAIKANETDKSVCIRFGGNELVIWTDGESELRGVYSD